MQQNLVWKPWTNPGVEHLSLAVASDGISASGQLIQSIRGNSIAATYLLTYDERWRFRRLWLKVDNQGQRSLELRHDIRGHWHLNGRPREDLADCQQVILSATPFTHTALLQSGSLAVGDGERFRVAHVDLLGLRVEPRTQRYQCLQRHASHTLYQCDAEGHEPCELTLDGDGLLVQAIGQFIRTSRQLLRQAYCA